jgi:hypothetical protein
MNNDVGCMSYCRRLQPTEKGQRSIFGALALHGGLKPKKGGTPFHPSAEADGNTIKSGLSTFINEMPNLQPSTDKMKSHLR